MLRRNLVRASGDTWCTAKEAFMPAPLTSLPCWYSLLTEGPMPYTEAAGLVTPREAAISDTIEVIYMLQKCCIMTSLF